MHTLLCRSSRCKVCRVSTEQGVLWGFCCGTSGKALSFPGHLCCTWTRLFQRSLKTESMHLPQKGAIVLLGTSSHTDCFLRPQVG